jgi:hypothetical protein
MNYKLACEELKVKEKDVLKLTENVQNLNNEMLNIKLTKMELEHANVSSKSR